MDFTIDSHIHLCEAINESKMHPMTVRDYAYNRPKSVIIVRHDIDSKPYKALTIARIESKFNNHATYYIRVIPKVFDEKFLREIESRGNEIGYHYEVVSKAHGDLDLAADIFKKEITHLRPKFKIETACMHGSSLKKWNNRDIWKVRSIKDFELIAEPYESIDFSKFAYFTDTGGGWNRIDVAIYDLVSKTSMPKIGSTNDWIRFISTNDKSEKYESIMITTHPQRWCSGYGEWLIETSWQWAKNIGKRYIKRVRG